MRYLPFLLLLTICLSCGSSDAQTEAVDSQTPIETTAPAPKSEPIAPPCETFSNDLISTSFGWAGSSKGDPTTMRDGRLQSCRFMSTDNSGQASVTISKSDERTIEAKYLEAAFVRDLAREKESLSSEELDAGLGDQALFTTGKKGPHHLYILRWRQGNETDFNITLRATKKQDKAAMLETLKGLAERI